MDQPGTGAGNRGGEGDSPHLPPDELEGVFVGIDLGGTNVRAGAVTPGGQMLSRNEAPIEARQGPEAGVEKISRLVESAAKTVGRPLLGIGIGSTGPLDLARGRIQNPFTLPGWEDVDIVSPLRDRFGVPVALENDADAAALGESWMGAGKGLARLAMVTIGTGVGTGLILDGKVYRGLGGAHPEGGHLILDPSGPACYCGAQGCWESLVSGPAIAKFARDSPALQASTIFQSCQGDPQRIEAGMVFAAARQGDSLAVEIVRRTANYIGLGLVSLMMLILPDCIVLTGGVLRSYDLLAEGIEAVISLHDVVIPAKRVQIQLSKLGQEAGMFGAARTAQLLQEDC